MKYKTTIYKSFLFCTFITLALSLQSCITFMLTSKAIASKQKSKSFDRAMQTPRGFGEAYFLCNDKYGSNPYKKTAEKKGYVIVSGDKDMNVYFVPKSEYQSYLHEYNFNRSGGIKPEDRNKRNLRGSDFKARGSAWLLERKTEDKFFKCSNMYWTGQVKNGLLDGKGDGYAIVKDGSVDVYYAVSGEFRNGHIIKAIISRGYEYRNSFSHKEEYSSVKITIDPSHDGLRMLSLIKRRQDRYSQDYIAFINDNYQTKARYDKIIKPFINGEAVVTDRGMNVVIDKKFHFVKIVDGATKIPEKYFSFNMDLKTITIPKSVKEIGSEAFYHCENLREVKILGDLSDTGNNTFCGCKSLQKIDLSKKKNGILGYGTFNGCRSLTSVILPSTLREIGDNAFIGCTSLRSVKFNNGLTRIHKNAFKGCTALTSISLPSSVTEIKDYAFRGCSSLTSATINGYVTKGVGVFMGCGNLHAVTIRQGGQTTKDTDRYWFEDKSKSQKTSSSGYEIVWNKCTDPSGKIVKRGWYCYEKDGEIWLKNGAGKYKIVPYNIEYDKYGGEYKFLYYHISPATDITTDWLYKSKDAMIDAIRKAAK